LRSFSNYEFVEHDPTFIQIVSAGITDGSDVRAILGLGPTELQSNEHCALSLFAAS
jgi:hypothetical protein